MAITEYKDGVNIVTPEPLPGNAGQMLNDNFKALADALETLSDSLASLDSLVDSKAAQAAVDSLSSAVSALQTASHAAATIGTANGLSVAGQAISLAAATTSTAGAMSASDKTKLDGVASGATANASDAELRDRTTHSGEQAISTVTGLQSALDGLGGSISSANDAIAALPTFEALASYLPIAGGTMGGTLNLDGNSIDSVASLTASTAYVDTLTTNSSFIGVSTTLQLYGNAISMYDGSGTGGGTLNMDGGGINAAGYVDTDYLYIVPDGGFIYMKSPDGTAYQVSVANGGTLTVTAA